MTRTDFINIQTTNVRHCIPNISPAAFKKWRTNMVTIDREIILSKLLCSKDLKNSAVRVQRFIYRYVFVLCIPSLKM